MKKPPAVIWLQFYGDETEPLDLEVDRQEVSWCSDKIFHNDVRYIVDKRYLRGKQRTKREKKVGNSKE